MPSAIPSPSRPPPSATRTSPGSPAPAGRPRPRAPVHEHGGRRRRAHTPSSRSLRILLLTPPMTQLNTPYPATAYLTGFLRQHAERLDLAVAQADPALELFLRLFSREGLARITLALARRPAPHGPATASLLAARERYLATIDGAIRFLQGRDPALALRIVGRTWLPEGPRFAAIE